MISAIMTAILIAFFFILGYSTQAFKKLIGLITKYLMKFLSFFGIKFKNKELRIKVSSEFKEAYPDIRKVTMSNKNIKQKSSIDWVSFAIFAVAGILVLVNLASVSGNAITNWLFELLKPIKIIKTAADMNTFYTASLFSVISFSLSRLLARWKETKQQRKERKEALIKKQAFNVMNSKELLEAARRKDAENEEKLK